MIKSMNSKEKDPVQVWIVRLFIIVFAVIPTIVAMCFYVSYLNYQDKAVLVTANVSYVDKDWDSDDSEYDYTVYISYDYNGKQYEFIKWKSGSDNYSLGHIVEVKIDPDDPTHIVSDFTGELLLIFPVFALSIGLAMLFREKSKARSGNDISIITGKTILNNIRFDERSSGVYEFLCIGIGLCGIWNMTETYDFLLIVSLLVLLFAFRDILRMIIFVVRISRKQADIKLARCVQKSIENIKKRKKEVKIYHTQFESIETTIVNERIYNLAEVEKHYYVLRFDDGKIYDIYDSENWRASSADENLAAARKSVLARICAEVLIGCFVIVGFIEAFEFIAKLLAK